jgi:hypothetical protein
MRMIDTMPRFFIPFAKDDVQAEEVLSATAKFVGRPVPPPHERIFRFAYRDDRIAPGTITTIQVGDPIDPYYKEAGPVIAIFAGNPLLVCMRDRGVIGSVEFFDDEASKEEELTILVTPSLNGVPARSLEIRASDIDAALGRGYDVMVAAGLTDGPYWVGAVRHAISQIKAGSEHPIVCEALLWATFQAEPKTVDVVRAGGVEVKIDVTESDNGHFNCRYEVLEQAR